VGALPLVHSAAARGCCLLCCGQAGDCQDVDQDQGEGACDLLDARRDCVGWVELICAGGSLEEFSVGRSSAGEVRQLAVAELALSGRCVLDGCGVQVVLVGDSRAGKSSLLAAFATERFETTYSPTVGVNFKARTVRIDDGDGHTGTVKLTLWDSAGAPSSSARACARVADAWFRSAGPCGTRVGSHTSLSWVSDSA
jgi:hypothetical protein